MVVPAVVIFLAVALFLILRNGGDGDTTSRPTDGEPGTVGSPEVVRQVTRENQAIKKVVDRGISSMESGRRNRRLVALTFDDGPGVDTKRILNVLERTNTPATFFVVGTMVDVNRRLLRKIVRSGHALGNHTQNHPMMNELDRNAQLAEINQVDSSIKKAGVRRHRLFRPPYRAFNDTTVGLLREKGDLMVLWDVDSEDYTSPDPQYMAHRVVREAKPGSVILMHDGPGDRNATARALPDIIKGLKRRKFRLVTIPRMVQLSPPTAKSEVKPGEVRAGGR